MKAEEIMTGETPADSKYQEMAAETMLGTLMDCVLEQVKALPKSWAELGQSEQEEYLFRIEAQCRNAVRESVRIISSRGYDVRIPVTIDTTTIKGNDVTVKAKMLHHEHAIDMVGADSQTAMIVLANSDQFLTDEEKPKAEPDQAGLELDGGGAAPH